MTTTLVYGKTSDAQLYSFDANYTNARNGIADGIDVDDTGYIGQHFISSLYSQFQSFIGWDYGAIPDTERVTSAAIGIYVHSVLSPGIVQAIECRNYIWSGTAMDTGDWRNIAQLEACPLEALYTGAHSSAGKMIYAGSESLRSSMLAATTLEHVVVTDRQRQGIISAGGTDEAMVIAMADTSGTSSDPVLIYTSTLRSTLFGVLGAQVQLTDGTWCYLESDGAVSPTITLKHETVVGAVTTVATLTLGTGAGTFATPSGAQSFALVVDPSDNLYVVGRAGDADNTISVKPWVKSVGYTWNAGTTRTASMPAASTRINNVAAAYHSTASGTLMVVAGHTAGPGAFTSQPAGMSHAALSIAYLLNGTGTFIGYSGYTTGYLLPGYSQYMRFPNETGSGLDLVAAGTGNPEWGYLFSFAANQRPGDNTSLTGGRFILNSTATSFAHASYQYDLGWGKKDGNAKLRVVPVSSTAAAFITSDADPGWGITIDVMQHTGTTSGSTRIGGAILSGESIATMPDGPAIAGVLWWDACYNSAENKLWIYYVSVSDAGKVLRTAFDLTTMQAVRNSITVYDDPGAATVQAIRVQRNKAITAQNLVTIALINGSTRTTVTQLDTFNLAPTAPTLTVKANYDATAAATFSWTFNDPNPLDTQSAYQLIIERVDTGATVVDTGKVVSATSSRNVTGSTLTNGLSYRWKVRTYDAADVVSPYSDYGTFSTSAGGTVTITSPATDNILGIITDDYPIVWSVSGTVQAAYRVILYRGGATISDTGWVASTATTYTVTNMTTDVVHTITVQVRNASSVVSGIATRLITPSYATPEIPLITASVSAEGGYIEIDIDNPPPGAPAVGGTEWGFEVAGDVTNWIATGGTRAHSTAQAHRDTGSMLLTTSGSPAITSVRNPTNRVAVTAGSRYTARMWVRCSVARNITVSIDWLTAGGALVSTTAVATAVLANTWTSVQVSGTAPATATQCEYGPSMTGSPTNGTLLYIDELILTGASDRPEVTSNDILRRKLGETGTWEVVGTAGTDGTYRDYEVASGVVYEYRARGNV